MPLSSPIGVFGIHSFTPYSLVTGLPFGEARVLGSLTINTSQELVDLNGGSSPDAWASERGLRTNEISMSLKEYPGFLMALLLGTFYTQNAGESTGGFSTPLNISGLSIIDATTGIATVTAKAGSESSMKTGVAIIKYVSATTVDVYYMSDVDFAKGTVKEFENDELKITASPLTVVTGAAVEVPGYGIELTGGSGTISFSSGDTGVVEIRAINTENDRAIVGGNNQNFENFGAMFYAQKQGTGEIFEFNFSSLVAGGMPTNMNEQAWSEYEVTLRPVRAVNVLTKNECLYEYRRVKDAA